MKIQEINGGSRMSYGDLVNYVEEHDIKTAFSVVAFLIGYKGYIDVNDYENICKLSSDMFIED